MGDGTHAAGAQSCAHAHADRGPSWWPHGGVGVAPAWLSDSSYVMPGHLPGADSSGVRYHATADGPAVWITHCGVELLYQEQPSSPSPSGWPRSRSEMLELFHHFLNSLRHPRFAIWDNGAEEVVPVRPDRLSDFLTYGDIGILQAFYVTDARLDEDTWPFFIPSPLPLSPPSPPSKVRRGKNKNKNGA